MTTFSPVARRARGVELQLRLLAGEADEVALLPEGALDAWGADLEVVAVRDEVRDVERGAQVAGDAGAEVEIDRGVARVGVRVGAAELLDEDAKDPAAGLALELEIDHLRAVRARDRIDRRRRDASRSMGLRLVRASWDMAEVGETRGEMSDDKRKNAAPRIGVRVVIVNSQLGA